MKTFTVRDIRIHSEQLLKETEAGALTVVSKHGHPAFVTVPFDDELLKAGIHVALAVKLYEADALDLAKAARLARMPLADFIRELGLLGIPAVRYGVEDFDGELVGLDDA